MGRLIAWREGPRGAWEWSVTPDGYLLEAWPSGDYSVSAPDMTRAEGFARGIDDAKLSAEAAYRAWQGEDDR